MRRLLFIGVLALLVFPSEAFAHATLLKPTPQFREPLPTSPPTVVLRFDQVVLPTIEVLDTRPQPALAARANGLVVTARVRAPGRRVYDPLAGLGRLVVAGVWTFGVGSAPPPTEAYGAGGPTRTEHVVRWLKPRSRS
jgi:hypothetical protein